MASGNEMNDPAEDGGGAPAGAETRPGAESAGTGDSPVEADTVVSDSGADDATPENPAEEVEAGDSVIRDEDLATDADFLEDEDEDASPIEEMLEPAAEDSTAEGDDSADGDMAMNWYILKVQVNREKSICDALKRRVKIEGKESFFSDILVPKEKVRQFNSAGKSVTRERMLYPGYIVVRMAITDDTWFLVRDTPGIGDFTGAAGKPASLTAEEVERIVATTRPEESTETGEETPVKTAIRFKEGDRVRVKDGYFQNYEGEVSNVDERNGRVTVMINIFNRPNPVELDHWQIEDI